MKILMLISAGGIALCSYHAKAEDMPPLPAMPELPGGAMPFNPTNPLGAPPALPDDEFDFFQPGAQMGDLPPLPTDGSLPPLPEESSALEAEPAPIAKAAPARNPHKIPLKRRFDYKIQRLPQTIYKKDYLPQNRHLPVAQTEQDYDQATFAAAASDNLNGLRAMLEHGGRSIDMRSPSGESLLDIAIRYNALTAQRYLMALGAPRS